MLYAIYFIYGLCVMFYFMMSWLFYRKDKGVFEDQLEAYADDARPLYERRLDLDRLAATMRAMG